MINNNVKWEWTSFEPQSAYDCISQVKSTALQSKHVSFRGLPHPGKLKWVISADLKLAVKLVELDFWLGSGSWHHPLQDTFSRSTHYFFVQSNNPPAISPLFFLLSVNLWLQLWHRQPGLPGLAGPRVFDNGADPRSNRSQTIWASWNQSVSGIESFLSC